MKFYEMFRHEFLTFRSISNFFVNRSVVNKITGRRNFTLIHLSSFHKLYIFSLDATFICHINIFLLLLMKNSVNKLEMKNSLIIFPLEEMRIFLFFLFMRKKSQSGIYIEYKKIFIN